MRCRGVQASPPDRARKFAVRAGAWAARLRGNRKVAWVVRSFRYSCCQHCGFPAQTSPPHETAQRLNGSTAQRLNGSTAQRLNGLRHKGRLFQGIRGRETARTLFCAPRTRHAAARTQFVAAFASSSSVPPPHASACTGLVSAPAGCTSAPARGMSATTRPALARTGRVSVPAGQALAPTRRALGPARHLSAAPHFTSNSFPFNAKQPNHHTP